MLLLLLLSLAVPTPLLLLLLPLLWLLAEVEEVTTGVMVEGKGNSAWLIYISREQGEGNLFLSFIEHTLSPTLKSHSNAQEKYLSFYNLDLIHLSGLYGKDIEMGLFSAVDVRDLEKKSYVFSCL